MDYRLRQRILPQLIDVSYQGEAGLRELVMKAADLIQGQMYVEALKAVEEFKYHLAKDDGLAVYGDEEILNALKMGALKVLVVDEDRPDAELLEEEAKKYGTKVYFLSSDIPEGEWIKKTFGGLIGILRYRLG